MGGKKEKNVIIEHPLDVVYNTLVDLFPIKVYRLKERDDSTHTLKVKNATHLQFKMIITMKEDTKKTTFVNFTTDLTAAVVDLWGVGNRGINTVLEALLEELEKQPKAKSEFKYCSSCSSENLKIAKYCEICGEKFS